MLISWFLRQKQKQIQWNLQLLIYPIIHQLFNMQKNLQKKQASNFLVYELIITLLGGVVQNESFLTSELHLLQLRKLFHILHTDALQMDYLAYFNSVLKYGIIFWENCTDMGNLVVLQKRIVRTMADDGYRSSCTVLCKKFDISPALC